MRFYFNLFTIISILFLIFPVGNTAGQTKNKNSDSTNIEQNFNISAEKISPSLFTYAGDRRYTLNGELPNLKTEINPTTATLIGGIFLTTAVWLHVHQEKGRSCRACHDVHASDHEGRIRDEFPFGTANIPMIFSKTENGGRCIPGCHRERGYDRVNKVDNSR